MTNHDININPNPTPVQLCEAQGHTPTKVVLGRCWVRYTCPVCNISWSVDSSD